MKYLSLAFAALFMGPAVWAQDLPPDISGDGGFEIEFSNESNGQGWWRYIGGTLGAVTADGDTASRISPMMKLFWHSALNMMATNGSAIFNWSVLITSRRAP